MEIDGTKLILYVNENENKNVNEYEYGKWKVLEEEYVNGWDSCFVCATVKKFPTFYVGITKFSSSSCNNVHVIVVNVWLHQFNYNISFDYNQHCIGQQYK